MWHQKFLINLFLSLAKYLLTPKEKLIKGKVGKDLNLDEAKKAARFCALNILSQLKKFVVEI